MTNEFTYLCQQIVSLTRDISLLVLLPTSNNKLSYTSGQYVHAHLNSGEILLLSMANVPNEDGLLEFHLRHDNAHQLAQLFIAEISKDKKVRLCGPYGQCVPARTKDSTKIIFLAGGTGFAPMKALLESAIYNPAEHVMNLYWGVRRPEDAYHLGLLKEWHEKYEHFNYTIVLSEPEHFPTWDGKTGLVHDYVAKTHPIFKKECVFASGPYPMIMAAHALFRQQGLAADKFICDMLEN